MNLKDMLRQIISDQTDWSWEEREQALAVSLDHAELLARGWAGEDVTAELEHSRAAIRNIAAARAVTAANAVRTAIWTFSHELMARALP